MIECVTVTYVEAMASVLMYEQSLDLRSIVVCGGDTLDSPFIDSCEELPIDAYSLPLASSWRSFASLPSAMSYSCMLQVNGAVRVCLALFST